MKFLLISRIIMKRRQIIETEGSLHIDVSSLKNCQINAYGIVQISEILKRYRCLKDLILDMNPNSSRNYYLLCSPEGKLQHLSLKLCEIADKGVEKISRELEYAKNADCSTIVSLDLSNNGITEIGAQYIGAMLRTNRSTLTHREVVELRREKLAFLRSPKSEDSSEKKEILDSLEDEEKKSLETIDTDGHAGSRTSSKPDFPSAQNGLKTNMESKNSSTLHPVGKESRRIKGAIMCTGNFEIRHLNLSFNQLSKKSLERILSCIHYQDFMLLKDSSRGLVYLDLRGNHLENESNESWVRLEELLHARRHHEESISSDLEEFRSSKLLPIESKILRSKIANTSEAAVSEKI
ncbi:leucine-rich repeat-containing protein 71 [Orussus abietinus]|uniref:leucine-rich repeat-containing protein 71 n=1 Tax=Orussus abietinus TaxID=222816 RepID=UPI000C716252|nr:leucine-rich repeat-containing protein 71 [Orussus abietinus]